MSVIGSLKDILGAVPEEWRGTTFKNDLLLGREKFAQNVLDLVSSGQPITPDSLTGLGNAEDYLRVATNLSVILELALAQRLNLDVTQVFTFASQKMPAFAIAWASKRAVHFYHGNEESPFTPDQLSILAALGAHIVCHSGVPSQPDQARLTVVLESIWQAGQGCPVDAVIAPHVLYILNRDSIPPAEILIVRKRTATPMTTPECDRMLHLLAGLAPPATSAVSREDQSALDQHLQALSGLAPEPAHPPAYFTSGLSALASLFTAFISRGGADVVMASTAYGGSSQLAQLMSEHAPASFRKHTFDIQGTAEMIPAILGALDALLRHPDEMKPTTVLQIEIPSNPDMKVPDLKALVSGLAEFTKHSPKPLLLVADVTFAPAGRVLEHFRSLAPDLPVIAFTSVSKAVSRGRTVGGVLVGNTTDLARSVLDAVRRAERIYDTGMKQDQLATLAQNHTGVEARCASAYQIAKEAGLVLQQSVEAQTGKKMTLAFVTPEQGDLGFSTPTFSFNLPPPPAGANDLVTAGLAQRFVNLLAANQDIVKPCVSFGQDNGLVYATVPATSTQGAVNQEAKAKQAVGGVQLVRLSFPASCDTQRLASVLDQAVKHLY